MCRVVLYNYSTMWYCLSTGTTGQVHKWDTVATGGGIQGPHGLHLTISRLHNHYTYILTQIHTHPSILCKFLAQNSCFLVYWCYSTWCWCTWVCDSLWHRTYKWVRTGAHVELRVVVNFMHVYLKWFWMHVLLMQLMDEQLMNVLAVQWRGRQVELSHWILRYGITGGKARWSPNRVCWGSPQFD